MTGFNPKEKLFGDSLKNKVFRTLWNAARQCYVVANEATSTAQSRGAKLMAATLIITLLLGAYAATEEHISGDINTPDQDVKVRFMKAM